MQNEQNSGKLRMGYPSLSLIVIICLLVFHQTQLSSTVCQAHKLQMTQKSESNNKYAEDDTDVLMETILMGGKKKGNKQCKKDPNDAEADFITEALQAKLPESVYTLGEKQTEVVPKVKLPDDEQTQELYRQIDEEGSDALISGTTADQLPFKKSDYAPNPEYNELVIPQYNGQMEVKDYSLTNDGEKNNEGRTAQEQHIYDAAYKAAYAAGQGGACADDALEAAHSAAYQTGQKDSDDYIYNTQGKNLDELDGSEQTVQDLNIQRGSLEEKIKPEPYQQANRSFNSMLFTSGSAKDYMDQAEDLIGDSFSLVEKQQEKMQKAKEDAEKAVEDMNEDIFEEGLTSLPKRSSKMVNFATEDRKQEDELLIDMGKSIDKS